MTPEYKDANHPPNVSVEGALERSALPGETIRFQASVSDPDEDSISLRWYAHTAGRVGIPISHHAEGQAAVQLPEATPGGETVYVILEATDSGSPAITRYARVTVNVAGE